MTHKPVYLERPPAMNLVDLAMAAAFFTSSFDLILVFTLGGTVRFAQLMMLIVMLAALLQILQSARVLWSRGATAMAAWCCIQGCLISQSTSPTISVQFFVLLVFTLVGIFAVLQLYGRSLRIATLMKVYLFSYVFVGCFGIFQVVTPSLHLGQYLVMQWVRHGQLPRINAFSYEPSFFATYLIMGWITVVDLKVSRARIVSGRSWSLIAVALTGVLILSTSKTALLLLIVEALARLAPVIWRLFRGQVRRLSRGSLVVPLPRPIVALRMVAVMLAALAALTVVARVVGLSTYLAGSGIGNTAAHSTQDRVLAFQDTLAVVRQHPWIGRSLGGVPGEVAILHGSRVVTQDDLRLNWGFPIPLDVLAASGISGFIPFVWFFWAITFGERRLILEAWPDERAKWLRALIRGLIFEWISFLADQNILRVYFWFHVAMVVVVGYNLRYFRRQTAPARQPIVAQVPA